MDAEKLTLRYTVIDGSLSSSGGHTQLQGNSVTAMVVQDHQTECRVRGCNKIVAKSYLQAHKKLVHGFGPQKICEFCSWRAVSEARLQIHRASHLLQNHRASLRNGTEGVAQPLEKLFVCEVFHPEKGCKKKFTNKTYLNNHYAQNHTKILPEALCCTLCYAWGVPTSFPSRSHLKVHMNKLHSGKIYKCDICGMTSNIKSNVTRHALKHEQNAKSKQPKTGGENQLIQDLRKEMAICGLRMDSELNIELDLS